MVGDIEKGTSSDYIQFQEASVRNQFVRKVYTLLSIQLVVTFCGVWASWFDLIVWFTLVPLLLFKHGCIVILLGSCGYHY